MQDLKTEEVTKYRWAPLLPVSDPLRAGPMLNYCQITRGSANLIQGLGFDLENSSTN